MSNYILVENRKTVLLGPVQWKPRFIQSELDDLDISFKVPPVEQGYINVGNGVEIFPLKDSTGAGVDHIYEQPAGPYFSYNDDNTVSETYNAIPLSVDAVKANLKQVVAAERYRREVAGTVVQISSGDSIPVVTDRDNRGQYATLLQSAGTNSVSFKTGGRFVTLSSDDLQKIVNGVHDYVQAQFSWEQTTSAAIDACASVEELKAIVIVEPVVADAVGA